MIKIYTGEMECILHTEVMDVINNLDINEDTEVVYSDNIDAQHPKNQVRQVANIVKEGKVKIVVTYSPYVLQKFAMYFREGNNIEFYYLNDEGYLINITDNLNVAFESYKI